LETGLRVHFLDYFSSCSYYYLHHPCYLLLVLSFSTRYMIVSGCSWCRQNCINDTIADDLFVIRIIGINHLIVSVYFYVTIIL